MQKIIWPLLCTLTSSSLAAQESVYMKLVDHAQSTFTVQPINSSSTEAQAGVSLTLPPDCRWECRDGLLGMQGDTILRGHWLDETTFAVEAGFDTWRRLERDETVMIARGNPMGCFETVCWGKFTIEGLDLVPGTPFKRLDFERADDTNFRLEPSRAEASLASEEGLLVTGTRKSSRFFLHQIFRQWTPTLAQ